VPLISPTLLSKRLRQLEAGGVIERTPTGHGCDYTLTEAGWELYPIIEAMGVWGQRWARSSYTPDELDPALLMWDMRRMLRPSGLRQGRTVIEFRFRHAPAGKSTYWLVVDDGIDLCLVDRQRSTWSCGPTARLTECGWARPTALDAFPELETRSLVRRFLSSSEGTCSAVARHSR
jgi:hypothetical protein